MRNALARSFTINSRIKRRQSLFSSTLLPILCLTFLAPFSAGYAQAHPPEKYEKRAMQALQRMIDAYRSLPVLEQRTEFSMMTLPLPAANHPFGIPPRPSSSAQTAPPDTPPTPPDTPPANPDEIPVPQNAPQTRKLDQKMRLRYSAPNRMRLEVEDKDPFSERVQTSVWVSDGKTFWSFIPEKNWYTREKAPGRIRDFARLQNLNATTLELLMLMHVNPFQEIKLAADTVRYLGEETVRAVVTEVIALGTSSRQEETELRLYIGKEDGLLHRLINDMTPVVGPATPGMVGDGLDELIEVRQPPPATSDPSSPSALPPAASRRQPFRTRLIYDNFLTRSPNFAFDTFLFTIPPGALLYGAQEKSGKKRQGLDILREFWMKHRKP